MQAIETFATIDNQGFIHTKQPLAFRNKTAKIIILINEQENEIDDNLWLKATALNPVFDFLNDEVEDIYFVNVTTKNFGET